MNQSVGKLTKCNKGVLNGVVPNEFNARITTMSDAYEYHFVKTNGITLHVVMAGPEDGPPVMLLHGFPEFWYGWHNQIPFLAERGYRVIVPDQRGYNLSDKPRSISAYHLDHLAEDIVGLMDALGYKSVFLAGHDWGAAVSWWMAAKYPQHLRKMVIMNVPYPTIMKRAFKGWNREQMRKSRYILAFQLPWLPERAFKKMNEGDGRNILLRTSKKDTFTAEDLAIYKDSWNKPGAVTGMINWYRAGVRSLIFAATPEEGVLQVPTLMLWGEKDKAMGKELAPPSIALCADGELIFFPNATHWLQHDEADVVNQHLFNFFR